MSRKLTYGWLGLGTMGASMAKHLHKHSIAKGGPPALVWNRTTSKAISHAEAHGTVAVEAPEEVAEKCDVLFTMLPTSRDVQALLSTLPVREGALVIDATSGCPRRRWRLAPTCSRCGARLVDAPVTGGARGADAGQCTVMMGGTAADVAEAEAARRLPSRWSTVGRQHRRAARSPQAVASACGGALMPGIRQPSPTDPAMLSSGMAVKAVNNVLNSTHMMVACEGLLTLRKLGIAPETALEVINAGSGASFVTQKMIPNFVLSEKYDFNFALGMMAKDCGIAADLVGKQIGDGACSSRR